MALAAAHRIDVKRASADRRARKRDNAGQDNPCDQARREAGLMPYRVSRHHQHSLGLPVEICKHPALISEAATAMIGAMNGKQYDPGHFMV